MWIWSLTMYLPSGMMIVILIILCYVPLRWVNGAFSCKDVTMYFSSEEMMVYLIHNSPRFILSSAVVLKCNVFYFSHRVKFQCTYMFLTNEPVFVFCCFFVSFLWWSQTVDVMFECFPCENSKCLYFLLGNLSTYEIHGKSNHDSWYTILDFFVWSMSLSVKNFFVWHSWAGGLKMSWPR